MFSQEAGFPTVSDFRLLLDELLCPKTSPRFIVSDCTTHTSPAVYHSCIAASDSARLSEPKGLEKELHLLSFFSSPKNPPLPIASMLRSYPARGAVRALCQQSRCNTRPFTTSPAPAAAAMIKKGSTTIRTQATSATATAAAAPSS